MTAKKNPEQGSATTRDFSQKTTVQNLKDDYNLMVDYAIKKGIRLPKQIALDNSKLTNDELVSNYNDLVETIAPATVESIAFFRDHIFKGARNWFQVPIYQKSLILALIALLTVIGVGLSERVNKESLSESILECSGLELLLVLTFICSSALLGVMFYILKTLNDKIKACTMTKIDELELNSQILVGIISGFLFSEVFSGVTEGASNYVQVTKMSIAILGGFSSDTLFSILKSLLKKISSVLS